MEDWRRGVVDRWEAERASRPTSKELDHWERTVAELKVRYRLADNPEDRAEICHRLAVSHVKMERYSQAIIWVELGLKEGSGECERLLKEDKATVLYLQDRREEAMAILDDIGPTAPLIPPDEPPKQAPPRAEEEAMIDLVCPICDADVPYGQIRCRNCGKKVDEKFTLVRSTKNGRETVEKVREHRLKQFSILLTEFIVDYDDPANFLTAHRVRFMGGERLTVTERSWFMGVGLLVQMFLYGLYGGLIWRAATVPQPPAGALVAIIFMMLATIFPFTLFYLYVIFPNFPGNPMDPRILDD